MFITLVQHPTDSFVLHTIRRDSLDSPEAVQKMCELPFGLEIEFNYPTRSHQQNQVCDLLQYSH